jgi:NTP pyrophosphatase (non-canonical NTP hydrolase)
MNLQILQQAINQNGAINQLDMATEESAELIQAINKLKRNHLIDDLVIHLPNDTLKRSKVYFDFISEVADVKIMIQQIELMLCKVGKEALEISTERKIEKLSHRLNKK